jgi:hypothetical protein
MEEKLLAFAATALNLEQAEVKELLEQDGGLEELTSKYTAHIKATKDAGYKSAERKVNTQYEQALKEKFGLQSDAKGLDLIEEVNEVIETKIATAKPTELSEAQIKKHPLYLNLEKQTQEIEKTVTSKFEQELKQKEEAWQQEKVFTSAKEKALTIIDSLKPILSEDPQKAAVQKSVIIEKLSAYKFLDNNGELVLLDKEGNRLENEHGHAVKFEEVVKTITTSYYDLQKVEQKSSASRQPNEGTPPTVTAPKTGDEYAKILADPNLTTEQKAAARDAWYASQS